MRAPPVVRAGVVSLAIALMLLVPMSALDEQRPAFAGWHMYAGHPSGTEVILTLEDGTTESIALESIAARVRAEPDYRDAAAKWVCERRPDVRVIRVTRAFPKLNWELPCDRS